MYPLSIFPNSCFVGGFLIQDMIVEPSASANHANSRVASFFIRLYDFYRPKGNNARREKSYSLKVVIYHDQLIDLLESLEVGLGSYVLVSGRVESFGTEGDGKSSKGAVVIVRPGRGTVIKADPQLTEDDAINMGLTGRAL